jgi:flotillin
MAKRMSAIDMESRTEVAKNQKMAKQAELEAQKEIDVTTADTERIAGEAKAKSEQAIGIANAESMKKAGIAKQESISEIAKAERSTAEQQMEVIKVNNIKQAEIDKEREIITAEQEKQKTEIRALADKYRIETEAAALLEAKRKEAEATKTVGTAEADVIKAKGISEAESKKAMELAGVTAQTTLAKEIGENKPYQEYLIRVKEVEVSQIVGVAQYESIAKALAAADLKLLVNSGDVHSGIGKLTDLFSAKGASQLNGLVEGLKQTEEGKNLMGMLNSLTGMGKDTPNS